MKQRISIALICGAIAFGIFGSRYTSQAQLAQDSPYQAMSDNFFYMLQHDTASAAIDYLYGTNPALKKMPDQADQLKTQFASMGAVMGLYVSHTMLVETKVAGRFVYQHYFVTYERQPVSIRIKYYRPGTTWVCYGLQFDGNLADDIQKVADENLTYGAK
jgi:hypothetical protein